MKPAIHMLMIATLTLGIVACNKNNNSINNLQTQTEQAPTIRDVYPIELPNKLAFPVNGHTIDTYQSPMPIKYTEQKGNTYYYDKQGNLLTSSTPNGYYRQILGRDTEGRVVVQDFYQATKTPYNAPFAIKQGGDESLFNRGIDGGTINLGSNDGFMAWFDKQGNLFATQLHSDGTPIAFLNVMKNGEWIGFIDAYNNKAVQFYPNTTSPLFLYNGRNYAKESPYTIYHQNGNGMASLIKDNDGNYQIVKMWEENGKPTKNQEIANLINKEYIPLFKPYFTHIKDFIGDI